MNTERISSTGGAGHATAPGPVGPEAPAGSSLQPSVDLPSNGNRPQSPQPRGNAILPAEALEEASRLHGEVVTLYKGEAGRALQRWAQEDFKTVPPQFQGIVRQTASMVGLASIPLPSEGVALPFAQVAQRLVDETAAARGLQQSMLVEDLPSALRLDHPAIARQIATSLRELADASRMSADALWRLPVAELRSNADTVIPGLERWQKAATDLHEQFKSQLGEFHESTIAALETRTQVSGARTTTLMRMAAANVGNKLLELPVIGTVSRLAGLLKP